MHSKFIFSFEVGGFCVEHLTKITRGIEPQQKNKSWTRNGQLFIMEQTSLSMLHDT